MTAEFGDARMSRRKYWRRVEVLANGCWHWGQQWFDQYGAVWICGRSRLAHRVFYEALVGPIPAGLQIDHLCRFRPCVNPAHLEPVTAAENMRRGLLGLPPDARETMRAADAMHQYGRRYLL